MIREILLKYNLTTPNQIEVEEALIKSVLGIENITHIKEIGYICIPSKNYEIETSDGIYTMFLVNGYLKNNKRLYLEFYKRRKKTEYSDYHNVCVDCNFIATHLDTIKLGLREIDENIPKKYQEWLESQRRFVEKNDKQKSCLLKLWTHYGKK